LSSKTYSRSERCIRLFGSDPATSNHHVAG
jgi:hypothetical protein